MSDKAKMKTVDIKGKPYVMVKDRILYFNEIHPEGSIRTELIEMTERFIIKATVTPDYSRPELCYTGHAEEVIGANQINNTSALENCETSAIGRAMALMGIGILESVASADEVVNAIHQQNGQSTKSENTPIIAEKGAKCPVCSGGVYDNKEINGQPKKSRDFDEKIKKNITQGLYQPLYKCLDTNCKGSIWEEVESVSHETAPHKLKTNDEELPF